VKANTTIAMGIRLECTYACGNSFERNLSARATMLAQIPERQFENKFEGSDGSNRRNRQFGVRVKHVVLAVF
jgi:hypothetical protein